MPKRKSKGKRSGGDAVIDLTKFSHRRKLKYSMEVPLGLNVGETRTVGLSHTGINDPTHDTALAGVTEFIASFNACRLLSLTVQFDARQSNAQNPRTGAFLLPGKPSLWDPEKTGVPANWAGLATPQTSVSKSIRLNVGPEFDSGRFAEAPAVAVLDTLLLSVRGFDGNARVVIELECVGIPQSLAA